MRIVVVGGAGFIGSALSRFLVAQRGATVLVIDKLTEAASLASLAPISKSPRYSFRKADIGDRARIAALIQAFDPDAIVHAAIEKAPAATGDMDAAIKTNLIGTWSLLEAVRTYWSQLPETKREQFRFLSVSNAEDASNGAVAMRGAADKVIEACHASYGLPVIVAKAAATYGPYQFPQAQVPKAIVAAMAGNETVTTDATAHGLLHIDDHVRALSLMLEKGEPGMTYAVTGSAAVTPGEIADRVALLIERHGPRDGVARVRQFASAAKNAPDETGSARQREDKQLLELGWRAEHSLETGLSDTVRWYLANPAWWRPLEAAQAANAYGLLRTA